MIANAISRLWRPPRIAPSSADSPEDVRAFIDSRALEYPSRLEDDFVNRALGLGVESGMVLDVGTRVGLVLLKLLWHNAGFFAIGLDRSPLMVERARETAAAWELDERAFFQVGDARQMRFKSAYFDLVVSDSTLHDFDDAAAVLREIRRVLKPRGALLIRDYRRPNRLQMSGRIREQAQRLGDGMRPQVETALRAAYTGQELMQAVQDAGLTGTKLAETAPGLIMIERRGETDPGSWVVAREQYR